jgi:D-serine deaminase-like pyridoxal phosphate-dependent protein
MTADWIPAKTGDALLDIDTPALVLDLDRFELNLGRLMEVAKAAGVRVRPHAKSHKCVEIARRQMAAGAVGVCCQKLSEAAVFLAGGIGDVLITNEVVGQAKIARLAQLAARHPDKRLGVCVDSVTVAQQLSRAVASAKAVLDVYIDIDVGQDRTGVNDPALAAHIANTIVSGGSQLRVMGMHAYAGSAQHRRTPGERRAAIASAAALVGEMRTAFMAAGLPCEIITGGGTGTWVYEIESRLYNEIQPGSFVLMDGDYARNLPDPKTPKFEQALFILSTVMSVRDNGQRPKPRVVRATLDAGLKAFSTDSGPAQPSFPGWEVRGVSDEHSVMLRTDEGPDVELGAKALLIPGHCDPTVNLHDWIVAVRKNQVEGVWRVDARGAVF